MTETSNSNPEIPPIDHVPDAANPAHGPDDPPWGSFSGILFWMLSVILIMIVPVFFLIPYFGGERISQMKGDEFQNAVLGEPTAVLLALGGTFGAHIVTLFVGWVIVTQFGKYRFTKMLGWEWGGFKFWHGLLIFIGIYVFAVVLTSLLGAQDNEMQKILRSSRAAVFGVALIATFSAPIVEEVVYRGVLYSAFQRTFGIPAAVSLVTLVFALVHVLQYYPSWATILSIVLLSFILTVLRTLTGNLWPCVVFHFAFNGFQSFILIIQPYLPIEVDPTNVQSLYLLN